MSRRDLRGKNRGQDDINIDDMSFEDFYYILDHYEVKNNRFDIILDKKFIDKMYFIEIPVLKFESRTISGITDKEEYVCLDEDRKQCP